ncbi:unnamed protein product [Adineta steineri]|uniref:Uncharacterized protein n=1 Tax=Adineta steineri TaxID=433720 RepID=A0A814K8S9_9BILA|nr:unnamed protein product [Adineta steineri]CAF3994219.1 unnamed protein product [Adineta steineri]
MMRVQGQTEQSDQPLVPLTSPPPVLQEPVEEQQPPQEQLLVEWLNTRRNEEHEPNCPNCRADMAWLLGILSPLPKCPFCEQYIGPKVKRIPCGACDSVYHKNELLDYAAQQNMVQQPMACRVCDEDMSLLVELLAAQAFSHNLDIQQIEQNIEISNFNSDSDFESETDAD